MAAADRSFSFRWLIGPMTPEAFFERHHRKQPVHVPGPPEKFARAFSWAGMNRLLGSIPTWTAAKIRLVRNGDVVPEETYCRPSLDKALGQVMRPIPSKIGDQLEAGATININEVEWHDPNLAAISTSLAMVFAAHARCNLYASRRGIQAFVTHFDTTDVFVAHVEGTKQWRVYERPFEGPAEIPGFKSSSHPDAYHDERKGKVLIEPTLTPGDVLYIPKGYYHDALASSDASLHLTFGIDELIGMTVLDLLRSMAPNEALFRESIPSPDDGETHAGYLARVAASIGDLITAPEVAARLRHAQKNHAYWDLPGFSLPSPQFDEVFRLRRHDAHVESRDGRPSLVAGSRSLALDPAHAPLVAWILDGDFFDTDGLVEAFPEADEGVVAAVLGTLVRAEIIETIADYAS